MNAPDNAFAAEAPIAWAPGRDSRVPYRVYTDAQLYQRELERLFYSGHWCYVGIEAEIPNPGDFKRTTLGEREVIHRDFGQVVEDRDAVALRVVRGGAVGDLDEQPTRPAHEKRQQMM